MCVCVRAEGMDGVKPVQSNYVIAPSTLQGGKAPDGKLHLHHARIMSLIASSIVAYSGVGHEAVKRTNSIRVFTVC